MRGHEKIARHNTTSKRAEASVARHADPESPALETVVCPGVAKGMRRKAPLSFRPDECNPFRLFEGAGLGHWNAFAWPDLIRDKRPDLYRRVYAR